MTKTLRMGAIAACARGPVRTGLLREPPLRRRAPRLTSRQAFSPTTSGAVSDLRQPVVASPMWRRSKATSATSSSHPPPAAYGRAPTPGPPGRRSSITTARRQSATSRSFKATGTSIWVGTGEANNRNSVAWGDGIYKSTDGGATFTNVGLRNTFQIARVVTHPKNPDIVYVAAVGQLWGQSGDRGLFKTIDGGKSWQKLAGGLPTDVGTGATELVMDPANPEVLYTAFYKRLRLPFRFESGSTTGGIFKSTDGGRTWKKLVARSANWLDGPYWARRIQEESTNTSWPPSRPHRPVDLSIAGSGVYRSEDAGETWKYLNTFNARPFYYSQIRINPNNDQLVYVPSVNFQWSTDGGKTIAPARAPFGSSYDHHAMWIDPNNKDRFYLGKDKGLTLTHDHGKSFIYFDNLPLSQSFHVAADMRDPYAIYTGLQDNGTWGTMSFTRDVLGIRNDVTWKLHYDDGQYIAIDPNDWRTVYSEGTNASFRLVDPIGHTDTPRRVSPATITNWSEVATPQTPGGLNPFRVNWTTPFVLSPHDARTIYYGANHLLKSTNGGVTWTAISKDLSNGDPQNRRITQSLVGGEAGGAEQHGTIITISESPISTGTIWVGTDDGNVWITRDDGGTWMQVDGSIPNVPKGFNVSRVVASAADANVAYVSFDGHRSDNRAPWLFRTADGGRTWQNLSAGLMPESPVVRGRGRLAECRPAIRRHRARRASLARPGAQLATHDERASYRRSVRSQDSPPRSRRHHRHARQRHLRIG